MHNEIIDPVELLGSAGPIAKHLPGYELRPQQIEMARRITAAFDESRHLVIEAGTGIGKSFAYLLPALVQAVRHHEKVIISTYTISLQEQLLYKDIPFIEQVVDFDFIAALAKGRSNYLCWRRLELAQKRAATLFDGPSEMAILAEINHWAFNSRDGSLSSLGFAPPPGLWEMICSESGTCLGSKCQSHNNCFYQLARRRLFKADLIIANHALLFSDLAVRQQGGNILPRAKFFILDEAHNVENVASTHFGLRLSSAQVSFLLHRLFNPRTQKGILAHHKDRQIERLVLQAQQGADIFFNEVMQFYEAQELAGGNGRVTSAGVFANTLSEPLYNIRNYLQILAQSQTDEQDRIETAAYGRRCGEFADIAHFFVTQAIDESVYWVEGKKRRTGHLAVICTAPLHIGEMMRKTLFEPAAAVILTSATLSTAGRDRPKNGKDAQGFEFFRCRLGLEEFHAVQLGSPFDYQSQAKVYVEAYLPDPRTNSEEFIAGATQAVKKYLLLTEGKAFVLFTNFSHLRKMAVNLEGFCNKHGLVLLEQGKDRSRTALLNEFRSNTNSVLLGTDSFWQGVDVPGASLSNVIIVKLPFSVPDHPLLQARLEQLLAEGGDPFFDYQLPQAILKFKQGFGRLIRSRTDKGIVVILDTRVITKGYGRRFLESLPPCPVEIVAGPDENNQ